MCFRVAGVKWNSGKPGKLSGFKSSKDLQHRAIPTKELAINVSNSRADNDGGNFAEETT